MLLAEIIYCALLFFLIIPVLTFCIQIFFAVLPGFRLKKIQLQSVPVALLIPAHNEAAGISFTLESIKQAATPFTRVIVIADNCTDNTAEVAKSHNVEVIERSHKTLLGKGYALDFGINYLLNSPPEVVIVFDADCIASEKTINALVQAAIVENRSVQALYLIQAKPNSPLKTQLAEFAYVVKNWTRPLGFYRLGMPIQLMGSGMAFPWKQIEKINLAQGHIVEDMKLGVDLAERHLAPKFCPEAFVTSEFPLNEEGASSQRKRWEHGHMSMILQEGLPLLFKGIKSFNFEMIAMALDLCVPPLALLFLISGVFALLSTLLFLITESFWPWAAGIMQFFMLGIFVLVAWIKHGTRIISLYQLLIYAPVYALSKIHLYAKFFINRQIEWVKTKRD